ncbi:hypothetical protein Tco_0413895 [Tanacetum coccineum]
MSSLPVEFNNGTSVSGYDEEEQNILYFNDKSPFNIIRPDDLKSEKEKNDNDVDIIHSSKGNEITHRTNKHMDTSCDKIDKIFNEESLILELNVDIVTWTYLFDGMLLCFIMNLYVPFGISFDPKRYYKDGNCAIMLQRLRYQGLEYTDEDITDFEERDYLELMRDGLFTRMRMEHCDDAGVVVFTSRMPVESFSLVSQETIELESKRMIPGKGDLQDYWRDISTDGYFLGPPPSYTLIRDPVLRLCHRMMAHSIAGRSQAPEKVTVTDLFYLRGLDVGLFNIPYVLARYLGRLAEHFGLLTVKILGGLMVIAPELPIIDMVVADLFSTWVTTGLGMHDGQDRSYLCTICSDPCVILEAHQTEDR